MIHQISFDFVCLEHLYIYYLVKQSLLNLIKLLDITCQFQVHCPCVNLMPLQTAVKQKYHYNRVILFCLCMPASFGNGLM